MAIVIPVASGRGGGSLSYSDAQLAGARPAGVFAPDDVRIIPYLGYNNGSYDGRDPARLPPIPLEWVIAPLDVAAASRCPTAQQTMLTFGLTNLAVAVLTLAVGCRPVLHRLSRGWLGARDGRGVLWTWAVSAALQLLANVFCSLLVVRTPGYERLSMLNVFALYAARPRANALWTALLRIGAVVDVRRWDATAPRSATEAVYADSYISSAVAELVLQTVGSVFVGVTWSRFPNVVIRDYMASYWKGLCGMPVVVLLGWLLTPICGRHADVFPLAGRDLRLFAVLVCTAPYTAVYIFVWLYWDTFLGLPGSLWCPPDLIGHGLIWTVFSTLSVLAGASA